ncbi:MAG: GNAT family N-acetyltransferase [Candidatus Methanomethylicia archaeon]
MNVNIRIEDLKESNIDDLLYVCSSKRLNDPIHQQGMRFKKLWLLEMLKNYGSIAKIAYHNDKPVAQILYYPETADITKEFKRDGVLIINCIYNPTPEAQKIGIGTKLLKSLILDVKMKRSCLGNRECKFILANAFNTGQYLPMPEFYKRNGFLPTGEGSLYHLPITSSYKPKPKTIYKPLKEDKNKAIILYNPKCQFSYPFAKSIEQTIKETLPKIEIKIINEWENPQESIKHGNWWLIVNAKPIQTFFMDKEKFKQEITQAATNQQTN